MLYGFVFGRFFARDDVVIVNGILMGVEVNRGAMVALILFGEEKKIISGPYLVIEIGDIFLFYYGYFTKLGPRS